MSETTTCATSIQLPKGHDGSHRYDATQAAPDVTGRLDRLDVVSTQLRALSGAA